MTPVVVLLAMLLAVRADALSTSGYVDAGEMACAIYGRGELPAQFPPKWQRKYGMFLCVDSQQTIGGALTSLRRGKKVCDIVGFADDAGHFHGTVCGVSTE